ncbi:hypothetical protein SH668x_000191 [Planctomicrobium sp. SH668]|uniref:hypothetical protein n=1 Tax=Planctomicrobium sp. SH668 TaxID=3448126 RepID=UPI003F5B4732
MSESLILEWSRDSLSALVAVDGAKGNIRAVATLNSIDHADPLIAVSQAGESLRAWLARENLTAEKLTVVIPRDEIVIRRMDVPQAPIDELPDLVRFQAATRTSAPIDTLVLDFLPLPSHGEGQDVIACTIDRDLLLRLQAVCTAAKLNLTRVLISPLTLGELVRSTVGPDLGVERPDLVVYQVDRRIELSIFDHGTLVFSHATQLQVSSEGQSTSDRLKILKSDLARSLVALSQTRPDTNVSRCFYVAGEPDSTVIALLEHQFPNHTVRVDARDLFTGVSTQGYEALAGALVTPKDNRLQLDLLHPRKKREVPDRRKLYAAIAGSILLLGIVTVMTLFYSRKGTLEESIESLRADVNERKEDIRKGKPRSDAFDRLARWDESNSNPFPLWNELKSHLPGTNRLYFLDLKLVPLTGEYVVRFVGKGHAKARTDVDSLSQALSDAGYRVVPATPTSTARDPDYPWEFNLNVEFPRPAKTVAKPAPKNVVPAAVPGSPVSLSK